MNNDANIASRSSNNFVKKEKTRWATKNGWGGLRKIGQGGLRSRQEPEVVGIVVEGVEMTVYKLDLKHDDQYRMYVLNTCYLPRKDANDISLIPTCIECMRQAEHLVNDPQPRIVPKSESMNEAETRSADPTFHQPFPHEAETRSADPTSDLVLALVVVIHR
ncbi:hypothetical protein BDC45DRAFT_536142 [Circinella umbellata]|nr:hypothetical protein BDC45DRAFT_536142 [Circinella umbellata]